jgi:hypothetical protein
VVNSNVKLVFKNAGAVYTLNAPYTILYTVQLDASSLLGGVRIRAAKGQHHFTVEEGLVGRGNLTAINIHFENAYRTRSVDRLWKIALYNGCVSPLLCYGHIYIYIELT